MDGVVPDYLIWIKVESEGLISGFRKVAVRLFRAVNKNHEASLMSCWTLSAIVALKNSQQLYKKRPFVQLLPQK